MNLVQVKNSGISVVHFLVSQVSLCQSCLIKIGCSVVKNSHGQSHFTKKYSKCQSKFLWNDSAQLEISFLIEQGWNFYPRKNGIMVSDWLV